MKYGPAESSGKARSGAIQRLSKHRITCAFWAEHGLFQHLSGDLTRRARRVSPGQ